MKCGEGFGAAGGSADPAFLRGGAGMMAVRRLFVLLLLAASVALPAVTQKTGSGSDVEVAPAAGILQRAFIPTVFYVGDTVELYLRLSRAPGERLTAPIMLTEPQKLPSNEAVKVIALVVTPRDGFDEARIRFIPFIPGDIDLPEIDAGPFRLPPVPVSVASILTGRKAQLAPIQGQLELPGTRLFLYGLVGAILLSLAAAFLGARYGLALLASIVESYRENQPYKVLTRTLKRLRDEIDSLDSAEFYDLLLSGLRRYLGARLKENCSSFTTSEMNEFFSERQLDVNDAARLSRIFSDGDLVKFASLPSSRERKSGELDDVEAIVSGLEDPGVQRA